FAFPVLIGDIGGTNSRFGVVPAPGEPYVPLPRFLTACTPEPVDAIRAALSHYRGPPPRSAIVAVANRVDAPVVRLTNAAWTIDAEAIGRALELTRVVLVNDYTPVAASAITFGAAEDGLERLGPDVPSGAGARLVLGPGTGLGAAALVPVAGRLAILATEAGHMDLGPETEDEFRLWPHIERVGGRVTAEVILSGPGLYRLCTAVAAMRGDTNPFSAPPEIAAAWRTGDCELATAALRIFARSLGRFSGDLALAFEASGGVFISGGIAPAITDLLAEGEFRRAFENKAPHEAWASRVPTYVITDPDPALRGLATMVADPDRFVFQSREWAV
ncbi:MAG TPA: glucokinase, partial [Microvirga sp.]|nr:glucokinase [Microvirga sp.]